jgi:hypothetical protein
LVPGKFGNKGTTSSLIGDADLLTLGGKTSLRKLVYTPIDFVIQKDQFSFPCWASLAKYEFPFSPISDSVQFFCLFPFYTVVCSVVLFSFFLNNKLLQ